MVEKRRGLGRGLGALIPSAPPEDEKEPLRDVAPPAEDDVAGESFESPIAGSRNTGRPADLFFETVTKEDVAEQPRSYSSALSSGISRSRLEAQTKRVAKTTSRKNSAATSDKPPVTKRNTTSDGTDRPTAGTAPIEATAETSAVSASIGEVQAAGDVSQDLDRNDVHNDMTTGGPAAGSAEDGPTPSSITTQPGVSRETDEDRRPDAVKQSDSGGRELVDVPGATFADIRLDDIHPNRKQPRTEFDEDELSELVHSIREIGVLQPIVVRPSHEGGSAAYELVMGERRWRASQQAGKDTVPAIIRSTLDDDLLRDALLENLHRSALNPLEEAAAYQQLLDDFGCSHDELAGRLGRSRPQISNTLRLMKLPPLVQRRLAAGVLSAGHARALLGLQDAADMERLAQRIVAEGLSVRSTEEIVALDSGLRRATKPSVPRDGARHERLDYLASSLSDRLDTNVKITLGAKKGRVSIEFASVDDLNRIVGVLSPSEDD